eukprot:2635856-Pyramimonas_sp.AAC.1
MFLEHVWRSLSCLNTSGKCSKDYRNAGTSGPCSKQGLRVDPLARGAGARTAPPDSAPRPLALTAEASA